MLKNLEETIPFECKKTPSREKISSIPKQADMTINRWLKPIYRSVRDPDERIPSKGLTGPPQIRCNLCL